jgi:hypothetical protein
MRKRTQMTIAEAILLGVAVATAIVVSVVGVFTVLGYLWGLVS